MNLQLVNNPVYLDIELVQALLSAMVTSYNKSISSFMVSFLNTDDMLAMNQKYLDHDTHTDVITFDYTSGHAVSAEVYISSNTAIENAKERNQSVEDEIVRLIIHSLLHCLGFKDKTDSEKEAMRTKEDYYISMFHVKQNLFNVQRKL